MLLLIGAIGLLTIIATSRKPGVKYFSVVTVFNRKDKLTETGAKLYMVFFGIAVLGMALKFFPN